MKRLCFTLALAACDADEAPRCRTQRCDLGAIEVVATDTDAPDAPDVAAEVAPEDDTGTSPLPAVAPRPPADCGQASMLADDFSAPLPFDRWSTSGGAAAQAVNRDGRATITLGPVPGFGGFFAHAQVSLWGSAVVVEVTEVPDPTTTARTALVLGHDRDALELRSSEGTLRAIVTLDGAEHVLAEAAWDLDAQRFWRIREEAGRVRWEYASDDDDWRELAAMPAPFALDYVRVALTAGTAAVGTSPGTAAFEAVNSGVANGRWCAAGSFADDFDGPAIDGRWETWRNDGCSLVLDGGALVMRPVEGLETACGMRSARPLDLRDGALTVAVAGGVGPAGVVAKVGLGAGDFFAGFSDDGPNLRLVLERGTDVRLVASLEPDLTLHRWWRLRAHDGVIYWETSPDLSRWTLHGAEPVDAPFDALEIDALIVQHALNDAPGELRLEHLETTTTR